MSEEVQAPEIDFHRLDEIISRYRGQKWSLIPLLQEVQQEFGFIPPDAIQSIADVVGVFPSQVQGVISFYTGLYTTPRGRNVVKVCRGTACHIRGASRILEEIENTLGIKEGETTEDLEYSLETVACIGACGLSPTIMINKDVYAKVTPKKISKIFSKEVKK